MEKHLQTRSTRQKWPALLWLLLFAAWLGFGTSALAQTTTITTAGTGFDAANGLSGNSFITFVVENTNTYDVILTGVDNFWKTGNNGTVPSLWYTTSALSGPIATPGIATPTWTNIITGTALAVTSDGFMPSFTNLNFVIPAGAQYRFALVSTTGISYSGSGAGTPNPNTFTTAGVTLKVHDAKVASQDVGYSGAFPTSTNSPRSFTGRIHFMPATPCVAPPTGGQATASVPTVCPNTSFQLGLTGASGGQGMTYQWQSSANGTTGWTNVTGLNNANVTTTQTTTTFYRAVLTCSGQTANSLPVQVTTNATPTSGTFTINKNGTPSATVFTSFATAIASIECGGVNGPTVFNVVAGSGPYNEQVVLPAIPGTSVTNTVTFNGNGNTISIAPSGSHSGIVTFDGADFVTFDNFTIMLPATATTGWGVQLKNASNNNTISNNTIDLPIASTSISVNGIVAGTATTTAGNNTNNTRIQNNTIIGGYYGININGNTGGTDAVNNRITGNTIRDNYIYNIYLNNTDGTLVENNNISRPTRTSLTTFYGVFLTGANKSTIISKNRIHNPFGSSPTSTSTVYVIYHSSTDAPVGSENIVRNNLIYNINTNGLIYALYNVGSDGVHYFYNTIDLSHPTNTGTVRGFFQSTAATNIRFNNNIVSVNSGSTGTKHALYFGTTTSAINSNNNVLYVNPAASNHHIGFYSSNQTTLANWQAANSAAYDQNSVSADPVFSNPGSGNLQPTNSAVNNIGQVIASVTDDIMGVTRGATPDPGAYEFTPSANDVGVVAFTAPVAGTCGASSTETVTITIRNFGTAAQSNIPVSYQIGTGTPVTAVFPGPLAPGAAATYTFTTPANLSAGGTFNFTASTALTSDTNPLNNSSTHVVNIINPISTFPHIENFETSTAGAPGVLPGGWSISPTTGFRWEIEDGPVTSLDTGPSTDHTTGALGGKYPYSESSTGATGDIAYLESPCINISALTTPGFEFWYHMYGATMGAMEVEVSSNSGTTWTSLVTITGQQQTATTDPWIKRTVSLAGYTGIVKIRFKAIRGTSFTSDMAIDDVRFFNIPANDAEVTLITLPTSGCSLTATENICITVKNNSNSAISNVPVSYTINGGTAVTETMAGPIAPGATMQYCFTTKANFAAPNTYTVVGTVALPSDGDPSNNSKTGTVTGVPSISTLPYSQNFENGNGGWVAGGTNSSWALGTPAGTVINSAASGTNAYVTNLTGQYNPSEASHVMGPCFNFTGVADPDFEMMIWYNSEAGWDGAALQSSIDGGATWQLVGTYQAPNNWYNDNSLDGRAGGQDIGWAGSPGSGGWVKAKHKLTGLGGQSSVRLRIAFGADASFQYDGFAFDDIRIGDNTGNLAINSFVALTQICGFTSNEKVEVVLENLGSVAAAAGSYTLEYRVDNATTWTSQPGIALAPGVPTNFTFTGGANLSAPGAHTVEVRLVSATDPDMSNNQVTYNVSNATLPSFPVTLDFETPATGIGAMRVITNSRSAVVEDAAAARSGLKGMIMDGVDNAAWIAPTGVQNPWTINPEHFSAAYICFDPSAGPAKDSLFMIFDLKQLFKVTNTSTNFRVTVNGTQVGPTYRPPFTGTPINWQRIRVDLTPFMNATGIQIGLESSVREGYQNGNGTANLIDNLIISRRTTGVKADLLAKQIQVSPNPSNGSFKVTAPKGNYSLEVMDVTGRTVLKQQATAAETQLNLKDAAKGIYLLKLTSEGAVATKRIVIE